MDIKLRDKKKMNIKEHQLSGSVHIDLSKKFHEKGKTGIAAINSDKNFNRGLALSSKLKKSLLRHESYCPSRLYAICIWQIIKQDINSIDTLIICNDANFSKVKKYLKHLFEKKCPKIKSLFSVREELGKKIKSLADSMANSYRKRAFSFLKKQGKKLNPERLSYKQIINLFDKLESFDKKILDKE